VNEVAEYSENVKLGILAASVTTAGVILGAGIADARSRGGLDFSVPKGVVAPYEYVFYGGLAAVISYYMLKDFWGSLEAENGRN